MREEEKWNQEAFNRGEKYYLNLPSLAAFKDGYLQARKMGQAEIDHRVIGAVDKLHEAEKEIEKLKEEIGRLKNNIKFIKIEQESPWH